jgi:transcriptional regulator with XRE-family HTH domain
MGTSALSQIENNKRNASSRSLVKLARALDVEVYALFPKQQAPLFPPDAEEQRRIKEQQWQWKWRNLERIAERYRNNPHLSDIVRAVDEALEAAEEQIRDEARRRDAG